LNELLYNPTGGYASYVVPAAFVRMFFLVGVSWPREMIPPALDQLRHIVPSKSANAPARYDGVDDSREHKDALAALTWIRYAANAHTR
jgi:hypothetical protein